MNKNIVIIIGIIALILIVGGVYASMNDGNKMLGEKMGVNDSGMAEKEMTEVDEMMDSEVDTMDEEEGMMKKGSYEAYSAGKIARAETGDVVLFFHASWCPSCRGLNANIEANREAIPSGVTILKTDYDEETTLKKKYGITYQHTLVQVDKDGTMIKKWSGNPSLEALLGQIQ